MKMIGQHQRFLRSFVSLFFFFEFMLSLRNFIMRMILIVLQQQNHLFVTFVYLPHSTIKIVTHLRVLIISWIFIIILKERSNHIIPSWLAFIEFYNLPLICFSSVNFLLHVCIFFSSPLRFPYIVTLESNMQVKIVVDNF